MEVSPKTLREVEFREKMRGYHPEDVDHFLEQVAAGIEVLQDRLRQAVDRASRAEAAASEAGGTDDTLRKTLVLAQRTADLAVQEAREQAARILASAEQQAQSILTEAEDRGRRTLEDTIAECRAELGRLETTRAQAQQDVETLQRWLEEHKTHLQASLSEALHAVERAGVLWPVPNTRSLDPSPPPRRPVAAAPAPAPQAAAPAPAPAPVEAAPVQAPPAYSQDEPAESGPATMMWSPSEEERSEVNGGHESSSAMPDPDDQALDDFFDDSGEFADDRRFGGRLRRRR